MKDISLELSQTQEYTGGEKLPVGGYICKIIQVTDVPVNPSTGKGDYLKIDFDIAFGEYKGFYQNVFNSQNSEKPYWKGNFIKSYKPTALSFFKGFITAIENSNDKFVWNGKDEKLLENKFVGLVLGEEETKNNKTGEIYTRICVSEIRSVKSIQDGKFNIPELKKLKNNVAKNSFAGVPNVDNDIDEDLPF